MADTVQQAESTVTTAAVSASGVWGQILAALTPLLAVCLPVLLTWVEAQVNAPKTATVAEADPAVDAEAADAIAKYDASGR